MNRDKVFQLIESCGVVAILRSPGGDILQITAALQEAGVKAVEVTIDTPGALRTIELLRDTFKEIAIGVGTVLDPETAATAIDAGAQFIVTPTLNVRTVEMANRHDRLIIPGVFTPTEILTAFEAGAAAVKVFPATSLGPDFIRQVRAPLPHIPLIPTGGINLDNVAEFIQAGSTAVGLGSSLIGRSDNDPAQITAHAKKIVQAVAQARGRE